MSITSDSRDGDGAASPGAAGRRQTHTARFFIVRVQGASAHVGAGCAGPRLLHATPLRRPRRARELCSVLHRIAMEEANARSRGVIGGRALRADIERDANASAVRWPPCVPVGRRRRATVGPRPASSGLSPCECAAPSYTWPRSARPPTNNALAIGSTNCSRNTQKQFPGLLCMELEEFPGQ